MYKGIKIAKNIVLVVKKDKRAYVVDEGNDKMLESARVWASGIGYYSKVADPYEELTYENGKFKLELLDSANGSSQGGKLSFWNCKLTAADGRDFIIGIHSDLLLDILKSETFKKGVCQDFVYLGRVKGNQVGVFTKNMESFQQAIADEKSRNDIKTKTTVKYEIGDEVKTLTKTQIYLGKMYQMYNDNHYYTYIPTGVLLLSEPKEVHAFGYVENGKVVYHSWCPKFDKKPKRLLTGNHYNIDVTKIYNDAKEQLEKEYKDCNERSQIFYLNAIENFLQYSLDGDKERTQKELLAISEKIKSEKSKRYNI